MGSSICLDFVGSDPIGNAVQQQPGSAESVLVRLVWIEVKCIKKKQLHAYSPVGPSMQVMDLLTKRVVYTCYKSYSGLQVV